MAPYHFCRDCDGTGWAPYYSETLDGELEEAYCLCPNRCTPWRCIGFKPDAPCPHPDIVRLGRGCSLQEHAELIVASKGVDHACEAIYYLRRWLLIARYKAN